MSNLTDLQRDGHDGHSDLWWASKQQAWVSLADGCPNCHWPLVSEGQDRQDLECIGCGNWYYARAPSALPYEEEDALVSDAVIIVTSRGTVVRKICKLFNIKERQAYNLLGSGKIPHLETQEGVYLPEDKLLAPIAERFRQSQGQDFSQYRVEMLSGIPTITYEARSTYGVGVLVGKDPKTVRRWIARGLISGWPVGDTYLIDLATVRTASSRSTVSLR